MRKTYQTDLSDAEWSCLEPYLPAPKATGRPSRLPFARDHQRHLLRSKEWLFMAVASPRLRTPWRSVYHYFRQFRLDGTWERLHAALRERVRVRLKRDPQPSAGIVETASRGQEHRGGWRRAWLHDGAKKVKGTKRHLLVDTQGFVLSDPFKTIMRGS